MVRRLLLAAAVVAAAAAVGEWKMVLNNGTSGCSCGAGIQTYNLTSSAYCPTSTYPQCDINIMVENNCAISCPGTRSTITYRNNSAIWLATKSISCVNGGYQTAEGKGLFNVMRPTCGIKASCNECSVSLQPTCAAGWTCKSDNLAITDTPDGCQKFGCAQGTLKLYDLNGAVMAYDAREMFCTVANKWSNYSIDGSTVGGNVMQDPFTANCVLPKACENCVKPNTATALTQLPAPFQTGYTLAAPIFFAQAESCSRLSCPVGSKLYGFSGNSTTVTGLEYTSNGYMECDIATRWTNGGAAYAPSTFLAACLSSIPPCQQCAQNLIKVTTAGPGSKPMDGDATYTNNGGCYERTFGCEGPYATITINNGTDGAPTSGSPTGSIRVNATCNAAGTAWLNSAGKAITQVECSINPCGASDNIVKDSTVSSVCKDEQNRLECPTGKKIEIMTSTTSLLFDKMTFVAGKGWMSFDCTGNAKLWKNAADIVIVTCAA